MKSIKENLSRFVIFCLLIPNTGWADCDFSKGITPGPNKTFVYTEACHQKVGQVVKDNQSKTAQIADLTKAITLKDLALTDADKSKQNWIDTSGKLEDRLQKVDSLQKTNEWVYFGLGVLTTFLAGIAAAKLVSK